MKYFLFFFIFLTIMINTEKNINSQELKPKKLDSKNSEVRVTFLVTVPDNTPEDAEVYIVGNHEKLGAWSPKGKLLKKIDNKRYRISLLFKKQTYLQFKFNRGSWATVEKDDRFHEMSNRTILVKKGAVYNLKVKNWADMGKPDRPKEHSFAGIIKTHKDFPAKKLKNKRKIWVYLPPSYPKNKKKRYPVLYAHDGNNVFDRATAFLGVEWELDDTAEKLIKEKKIREIIIVAIENNSQRDDEYTHTYVPNHGGGKADLYADFIINDLKPFIDKTYRTLKSNQYTGIMGSSLGGLVSLYIAWKHSDVFSMSGVVSPSIWWGNKNILKIIKQTKKIPKLKIWVDIGTLEGYSGNDEESDMVKDARELRDLLISKGFKLNKNLKFLEVKDGEHNEAAWAKRVDQILIFFFGTKLKMGFLKKMFKLKG